MKISINLTHPHPQDSVGDDVTQCYQMDDSVNCFGGLCVLNIVQGVSVSRMCSLQDERLIGIDIDRIRVYPETPGNDIDSFFYACDQDLCNGKTTESSVQPIIQRYSSSLDVVTPSSSTTSTVSSSTSKTFLLFLSLLVGNAFSDFPPCSP